MGHTEVTLEYFTPAVSKQKRTFDEQQNSPQEWEHNDVSVERYFVNCFNLRAKPDFRKRGGAQTEHCEQDVAWSHFFGGTLCGSNSLRRFHATFTPSTRRLLDGAFLAHWLISTQVGTRQGF